MEMNCNFVCSFFFTLYFGVHILVIIFNHEFGVFLWATYICVYNQCMIVNGCMFVVQICCYNNCEIVLED
jgi:hypothetical protein